MMLQRILRLLPALPQRLLFVATLAVAVASVVPAATGRPLVPAERRYSPYDGVLPPCNDLNVFERIQSRFHAREAEFWNTGLQILGFEQIQEIGYRTNGLDYIPRRYCMARAYMNDAKLREISYSINQDLGIIGWFGFGVEWCVGGLDRNDAYAPNCKMARP